MTGDPGVPAPTGDPGAGAHRRRRVLVVPAVLVVLAALGVWLVLAGDDDADDGSAAGQGATLGIEDTTQAGVEDFAGLSLPPSTRDFLTARLDDGTQLDVTFTIDPAEEAAFVEGSGLPEPVPGERYITHSSPMWELNPGGEIRGAQDASPEVLRRTELLDEDGRVRVRVTLTPNG